MSIKMQLLNVALAAAAMGSACASNSQGPQSDQSLSRQTTLLVENNNWSDMAVYLVRNGLRARVGTVPSFSRARFVLSDALVGGVADLRLLADPIGSNQKYLSDPIRLGPGQQVRFRLENNVQLSSYSVY
ncbi:MAG: hypothetical protein ACRENP_11305 [Longimicrobiales bacterium]